MVTADKDYRFGQPFKPTGHIQPGLFVYQPLEPVISWLSTGYQLAINHETNRLIIVFDSGLFVVVDHARPPVHCKIPAVGQVLWNQITSAEKSKYDSHGFPMGITSMMGTCPQPSQTYQWGANYVRVLGCSLDTKGARLYFLAFM